MIGLSVSRSLGLLAVISARLLCQTPPPAPPGNWLPPFQHVHGATVAGNTGTDAFAGAFGSPSPTSWPITVTQASQPPEFLTIHMALIPKGPLQGKIIVWDRQDGSVFQDYQRYAILDLHAQPRFDNRFLPMPTGLGGDMFCAGLAWTPFGDLLVAGGTSYSPPLTPGGPPQFGAAKMVWMFDPAAANSIYSGRQGQWIQQQDLVADRWYPTVTLGPLTSIQGQPDRDVMLVLGGSSFGPPPGHAGSVDYGDNTYEAYFIQPSATTTASKDPRSNDSQVVVPWPTTASPPLPFGVFLGAMPLVAGANLPGYLFQYPRTHLLSNGRYFVSGWGERGGSVDHELAPGLWDANTGPTWPGMNSAPYNGNVPAAAPFAMMPIDGQRLYNSVVLFPRLEGTQDTLVRVGGKLLNSGSDFVEQCRPLDTAPANESWTALPPISFPRTEANLVILPDASLLLLSGSNETPGGDFPTRNPELFKDGLWTIMRPEDSDRAYHGTALLLPDARVLVAGAEDRQWDYQVFEPPYLQSGLTRPAITAIAGATYDPAIQAYRLSYDTDYDLTVLAEDHVSELPLGTKIDSVVLIAPGAITHHSDMHQRFIELSGKSIAESKWAAKTPLDSKVCPRGFYMMFAVTNHGMPSVAAWVRIL